MKQFIYIAILQTFGWLAVYGQPPLNQRYIIDETSNSIFSNIFATDSCYYVGGMQTSLIGINNLESSWIRFNFDGSIDSLSLIKNDTLGIGFWMTNEIIKTLDSNFASFAVTDGDIGTQTFLFLKFNHFGDTLLTEYYPEFYNEDLLIGKEPASIVQISDSSYFGVVHVQRADDLRAPTVFFRLSKSGELIFF